MPSLSFTQETQPTCACAALHYFLPPLYQPNKPMERLKTSEFDLLNANWEKITILMQKISPTKNFHKPSITKNCLNTLKNGALFSKHWTVWRIFLQQKSQNPHPQGKKTWGPTSHNSRTRLAVWHEQEHRRIPNNSSSSSSSSSSSFRISPLRKHQGFLTSSLWFCLLFPPLNTITTPVQKFKKIGNAQSHTGPSWLIWKDTTAAMQ
mgnify:FL=1